ncbi:MAG: D-tyrosyl-tRNA(Tyr) deacylase [Paludibacteraceae bacterium]|nr:D-tyrosyl-tRNA(Tyr) deacylase [Paludibacteraceae bacterium]
MRVVVQRVNSASVSIEGEVVGKIGKGFLLLVGITHSDTEADVRYIAKKVAQMRVFSDTEGKMNLSLSDISDASVLSISQFTLYADCRHGNRPSFIEAARPDKAEPLYEYFNRLLSDQYGLQVQTGRFGADMQVSLVNDGPVTIVIDSIS